MSGVPVPYPDKHSGARWPSESAAKVLWCSHEKRCYGGRPNVGDDVNVVVSELFQELFQRFGGIANTE